MRNMDFNWQHVIDGQGISVSITGMLIVFFALTLITVFIAVLPKILAAIEPIFPSKEDVVTAVDAPDTGVGVTEEVAAAIAFSIHLERLKKKSLGA